MKKYFIIMAGMVIMLLLAGGSGASNSDQDLLDGSLIPKFVDPLPVAGDISVVDATSAGTPAYNIHIREFQSQILPSTGVPADSESGFAGLPADTASWVWGYLTDADVAPIDAAIQAGEPLPVRPSFLGPVVIAERGVPAYPTYMHELPFFGNVQENLPVDMTLDWSNPHDIDCMPDPGSTPVGFYGNPACGPDGDGRYAYMGEWPSAVHIHGGEVAPAFDGGPDAWTTQEDGHQGIAYPGDTYTYPNGQEEGTIWFHPHEFGVTRLAVYAGLAGVYPIIDTSGRSAPVAKMPAFPDFDIPLIIQDRSFDTDGQIFYNLSSNPQPNPSVHPFWIPEFIGDVICVNGKTWPYLEVEPRQYRFRLLNGSNARFYDLTLDSAMPFIAIATDDGYMYEAKEVDHIVIAPGERYEVIVDFSSLTPGDEVIMKNSAGTPFPDGDAPVGNLTDTVMKFNVVAMSSGIADTNIADGTQIRRSRLPNTLITHSPRLGSITRQLTLNEVVYEENDPNNDGPLELVVNNSKYNLELAPDGSVCTPSAGVLCRETELPAVGDTEIWEIINISADAHPMHTHLVSFQVLERIPFNTSGPNTGADWIDMYETLLGSNGVGPGEGPPNQYNVMNADGAIGGNPAINDFLNYANANGPEPYEMGWKDTVISYPGEVTRIVIRWAPQDASLFTHAGQNKFPFDPTDLEGGVGYVWHCHILDHEDNEMMRNYTVGMSRQYVQKYPTYPDFNDDGRIDLRDLSRLLRAIRRHEDPAIFDVNGDGILNFRDVGAFLTYL